MNPMLNIAISAARAAGKITLRYLNQLDRLTVESKGRNDFVSQVDRLAEAEILRVIHKAYPDHAVLAEEGGRQGEGDHLWVIDPLDGTTNYLHGYPQYAVSIALNRQDKPLLAVIFDPLRDELYTTQRGGGAYLNNRRIRVSRVNQMEGALLGTGFPFKSMTCLETWMDTLRELLPRTSGVRRAGSAALDLAHVACGRLDGFWEFGLEPWDIAAGALLIEEAGGLVSDFAGERAPVQKGDIVGGNPKIHAELLQLIQPHLPKEPQS